MPSNNNRPRKTRDEYWLMGNYGFGHGWEYITAEDSLLVAKERLQEYRENQPEYAYTVVKKRIRLEEGEKSNG